MGFCSIAIKKRFNCRMFIGSNPKETINNTANNTIAIVIIQNKGIVAIDEYPFIAEPDNTVSELSPTTSADRLFSLLLKFAPINNCIIISVDSENNPINDITEKIIAAIDKFLAFLIVSSGNIY